MILFICCHPDTGSSGVILMKIAIIDNSEKDIGLFTSLAGQLTSRLHYELDILTYKSGEDFLKVYTPVTFDIVFMEMDMDGMNGIEVAKELRKIDFYTLIVFLTGTEDAALLAAPLHIFDYIIKPCTYDRLRFVLEESKKILPEHKNDLIFVCGKRTVKLKFSDIIYIESNNNNTIFTMNNGMLKYRIFFSKISELLTCHHFLICTRGVALNMDYITNYDQETFQMADGRKFPIRRRDRTQIIDTFKQYQLCASDKKSHLKTIF